MSVGPHRCGGAIKPTGLWIMFVEVITDGLECDGTWECRYPASSDLGTIEMRGGGPDSILDFVVGAGFNGDLQNNDF